MDEGDTCRICRTGAEDDAPLYHPCKCSGSIAKVHQECLIEWLQHSKKKSCELCHTELRFHKVYSASMPSRLPSYLYVRRLVLQLAHLVRLSIRAAFVAGAWLALLPLGNIYIWRLHFWIVDVLVWGLSGGEPPSSRSSEAFPAASVESGVMQHVNVSTIVALANQTTALITPQSSNSSQLNTTAAASSHSSSYLGTLFPFLPFEKLVFRVLEHTDHRRYLDKLARDTFEGQMLTCALVVLFVALFLLREWCLQNMPQDVEGLEEEGAHIAEMVQPLEIAGPALEQRAEEDVEAPPILAPELAEVQNVAGGAIDPDVETRRAWEQQEVIGTSSAAEPTDTNDEGQRDIQERPSLLELRARRARRFDVDIDEGTDDFNAAQSSSLLTPDLSALDTSVPTSKGKEREEEMRDEDGETSAEGQTVAEGKQREHDDEVDEAQASDEALVGYEGIVGEDVSAALDANERDADRGSDLSDAAPAEDDDDEIILIDELNDHDPHAMRNEDIGAIIGAAIDNNDAQQHAEANGVAAVGQAAAIQPVPRRIPGDPFDGDWEDELDNGDRLEDDLEGMMEAIGMRGPVTNLLTNMTMMFVLCSFILTVFVALPYMMGRLLGVGQNVFKSVAVTLRLLRKLTDPIVDWEIKQLRSIFGALPASITSSRQVSKAASTVAKPTSSTFLAPLWRTTVRCFQSSSSKHVTEQAALDWRKAVRLTMLTVRANGAAAAQASASFGRQTYADLDMLTQGKSTAGRSFCIALGHAYWLVGLGIQSRLSDLYVRWNLKTLKSFVDQQLIILKVLGFILLELVFFPLCCGVLTDIALFPLWQDVGLASRWALLRSKPLSLCFTLWSLGTLYMFALAQFVAHTRSIVRPGVLCFVRDAGDPNFHPIRDILERRSLEQLRKIGISGVIYSGILAATLGLCARMTRYCTTDVLPLQWDVHRAMSSAGLELLSIAVLLPIAAKAWLPSHWMRRSARRWWKVMARTLRISSYLIGGRYAAEEGHYVWHTWSADRFLCAVGLTTDTTPPSRTFVPSGEFARVPADDHAVMTSPLIVRTDANGVPTTAWGKEAVHAQEEAIAKMTRKPQYTVVYLPPRFRLRIIALFLALWATLCALLVGGFVPPLLVGRSTLSLLSLRRQSRQGAGTDGVDAYDLHDGYAYFVGCCVFGVSHTAAAKAQRMVFKMRQSSDAVRRLGKHVRRFCQRVWLGLLFGFVTSTLLGLSVEVYLNALSRVVCAEPRMPNVSLLHVWSMGVLEQQLVLEVMRIYLGRNFRPEWLRREGAGAAAAAAVAPRGAEVFYALLELQNGGWRRPRALLLTRRAFVPALSMHLLALVAPPIMLHVLRRLQPAASEAAQAAQVSAVYLFCLLYAISGLAYQTALRRMDSWTDVIKDEYFLVSTELKNYTANGNASGGGPDDGGDQARVHALDHLNAEGPIPDALLRGQ